VLFRLAAGQTSAQLIEQLEMLYAGADGSNSSSGGESGSGTAGGTPSEGDAAVQQLYREWVHDGPGSEAARQLLHTQYHKREKTVTAALSDW